MTPKFKRALIVESLCLLYALVPIALLYYVNSLGEEASEELYIFFSGLNAFMAFPALAVITSVTLALFGFESYLCCLPAPVGFLLGNITVIKLPIINALVYAAIYAAIGLGLAALILLLKRRREADNRILGRR